MTTAAKTVEEYLQSVPEEQRLVLGAVRETILRHLPQGYEERMVYGMIGYVVPHSLYPAGYHCNPKDPLAYATLGSQKNHLSLYLMTVYGDPAIAKWFTEAWNATGRKLDMGKACVRFKKLEDVPLEIIGQVIARVSVKDYIARVEAILKKTSRKRQSADH
ncbi:MAG TPA: DUF1801 domain-containing protein [Candidatus Limnocylindria bacterium]|nr:DUF1801 domain-containing protein [Candidatus Limnocylindria bacterium]